MGSTIPKIVATSPDNNKIWGRLKYKSIDERSLKKLRKNLSAYTSGKMEPEEFSFPLHWSVREKPGSSWKGDFISFDEAHLMIKDPKGKTVKLKKERVGKVALAYAEKMSKGSAPTEGFQEERWTSSGGKEIKATFQSLKEGQITLLLPNGKVSSFPVSRLSEASQNRAHELAGNE